MKRVLTMVLLLSLLGNLQIASCMDNSKNDQAEADLTNYALILPNNEAADNIASLPDLVDNSKSQYFPPISNQGSPDSSVAFAVTYYQLTYMNAKVHGYDVKSGDQTNIMSTRWTLNLTDMGLEYWGSDITCIYSLLSKHGCATQDKLPYINDKLDSNMPRWPLDSDIWREALNCKIDRTGFIEIGSKGDLTPVRSINDRHIYDIKNYLNAGYTLVFNTSIKAWVFTTIKDDPSTDKDNACVGKDICYMQEGTDGTHCMTVVGYNDNIWTDINGNGRVDPGEKGAFRVANAWGREWKDAGFTWIAYDSLNKVSSVTGRSMDKRNTIMNDSRAFWLTVKRSYTPKLLAEFTLNSCNRGQINMFLGCSDVFDDRSQATWKPWVFNLYGRQVSFDGTNAASDCSMVMDLTDLVNDTSSFDEDTKRWFLNVTDKEKDDKPVQIKDFKLIDVQRDETIQSANVFPIIVNGSSANSWIDYAYKNTETEKTFWSIKKDMPSARKNAGAGSLDGKLYVVGGEKDDLSNKDGVEQLKTTEVYDPKLDTWVKKTDMCTARHDLSVIGIDGGIYAIGGSSGYGGAQIGLSTTERYDPISDRWERKASLSDGRASFGAVVLNGMIYCIGGWNGALWKVWDTVEVYNPQSDQWMRKASMKSPRFSFSAVAFNDKIYAFGGFSDPYLQNPVNTVEVYDPSKDSWSVVSTMPGGLKLTDAFKINEKMYLLGTFSCSDSGGAQNSILVFDPILNTWQFVSSSPASRENFSADILDGEIYMVGGIESMIRSVTNSVEAFNPNPSHPAPF